MGAILAGGKSKRMGEDKAFIKIGDIPLIERAVKTMKVVVPEPMIITNEPEKFTYLKLPLFSDIIPQSGPLGGIYTALEKGSGSHVLVLACDMPSVTPRILHELASRGRDYDVFVLDAGFGMEPLCAVYSQACIPVVRTQIQMRALKVTNFYPQMEKVGVLNLREVDDSVPGDWFFNINSPYDRAMAERIFQDRNSESKG